MTAREWIRFLESIPPDTEVKMYRRDDAGFLGLVSAVPRVYPMSTEGKVVVVEMPDWE